MINGVEEIADLRNIADEDIPVKRVSTNKPYKKRNKPFIKGPIDLDWISQVALLPGKALNVGLALMYLRGLTKSNEDLKLADKHFKTFNISRKAVSSALALMEEVGLVKVERVQGRKNRITIIDPD